MSTPLDNALATLGLRPDADARSVRRAYAQQLKQIDQATQAKEFQALREAYELALHVISRREAEAAREEQALEPSADPRPAEATPALTSPEPPREPTTTPAATGFLPPDSGELAKAVLQTFAERAAAGFKDEADANAALQDALADDRLLNLEARTLFELQVAHLIMSGWQPGHEFLFGPACEAFNWEKDRAHLRVFGQLGASLDAAINESLIFLRQDYGPLGIQRNVLARLRETQPPSANRLRADLPIVQLLVQRFPNWLRLVTPQDNINAWFRQAAEAEPLAQATQESQPTVIEEVNPLKAVVNSLMVFFALLIGLFLLIASMAPEPSSSSSTWERLSAAPTASRPSDQLPALERFVFLDDVALVQSEGRVFVDEVGEPTRHGASSLRPGDRLMLSCKGNDARAPLSLIIEARRCGITGRVDEETSTIRYTFPILRDGKQLTASMLTTRRPDVNDLRVRDNTHQPPGEGSRKAESPAPKAVRIGPVTFAPRKLKVIVSEVADDTDHSSSTLRPGDWVLGCVSSAYHLPLVDPAEVERCVATGNANADPDKTRYMYRVLRDGGAVTVSLTLRKQR